MHICFLVNRVFIHIKSEYERRYYGVGLNYGDLKSLVLDVANVVQFVGVSDQGSE